MDFVYERTFPVGKEHTGVFPHVHDLDWNPNAPSYDALGVLVCASRGGTVIIRIDEHGQRHSGTLLCNRKSPPGRHTLSCKWSIHDPRILATGGSHRRENTERGRTGGIIRLLMYNGTRFEVMQSFKVHDGEDVSQLSWERKGKFLLATVNRGGGQAKLYIINHASRSRSSIAQIIDHPQADSSTPLVFTAKFHPMDTLFISVAGDTVWIWRKDTIQSKWKDTHVLKINAHLGQSFCRHPLVCFDEPGEMLAVCEGDNSISVWSFVPEEMLRRPEMKLLTRRVDLERIVSLDWIKHTIVVVNASSTCVYTVNKNLLINGTGDLKLTCKRLSHTHYYEQLCVKIDPRCTDHVASGGKDGYATVWKCVDKKDTVPMRKRNYLAEALYYKREGSPPPTDIEDQTGDDDIDVRTLIRCETSDEDETDKEDIKGHKAPSTGVVAGATQEEYASVGALPLDMSKIPIGKKMFCNKPFSMEPIAAVGFQMECTLARYKFEQFGDLVYRNAIDKLVNKFYQPEEILQWRFDSKYMIRGLVLDKNKGNILKIDKYNSVEVAFHGLEIPLSKEEIAHVYGNQMLIQDSFAEPDYATIDNVFSIVEAYLFAQLVTFKNKSGKAKYEVLHRDVRHAIDICCRDGCLEQEIQKDPSRYIHMDPAIIAMLRMIRESGRRTFLVTTSLWEYTNVIMNYICTPSVRDSDIHPWLEYFDVVMTRCLKPHFFNDDQAALLVVEVESGKLINVDIEDSEMRRPSQSLEQRQKVYQGGNAFHIQRLLAVESSSQIFYASQQLYEDVFPSKKDRGWRTMLVIPELEQEIDVFAESSSMREELGQLRIKRSSITNEIHHCTRSLRYQALVEKNKESAAYVHSKEMSEDKHQSLLVQLGELNLKEQVARRNYHEKFNLHWGQMMKTGHKDSRFADQVMTIPCLYTSSLTNLTLYDWEVEISPQEDDTAYELSELDLT